MTDRIYDIAIIGGGINGAGIARDAAGRGLRVILVEQDDLAAHTSSASTKLIHGGLRYLEQFEFMLVRKALQEREVILRNAPHITWPLRFVMPHNSDMRPEWMIRAGLFLYDNLARREQLPDSETVRLQDHAAGTPLKSEFVTGFVYSDGWVDDARLVVLNALDAHERGAHILTRTRCIGGQSRNGLWEIGLQDTTTQAQRTIRARALVNAAGPWVERLLTEKLHTASPYQLRLVKGSHIIVPKLFDHPYAYIFQNPDNRIIFAIPYQREFTLIGTTDIEYHGDPAQVTITADEIQYLCDMTNRYFNPQITPAAVVSTYSGVRPLLEDAANDASSVTRDYLLELDRSGAPLLSVFGGKITTYRKLAEDALEQLAPLFDASDHPWTRDTPLPGGDMLGADIDIFMIGLTQRTPWLPDRLRTRLARAYGARVYRLLDNALSLAELGAEIAPQVYECELRYSRDVEFARSGDDFLWRRSKLGLHLNVEECAAVTQWFEQNKP
ncbi:MAG: glycerol-3-phosphate dehydrogenase [Burkholderiaceae bacterium]|nr:MAG: glycerol-3-phosphate dehydrogenase [Burkholderiaceae bacterium]